MKYIKVLFIKYASNGGVKEVYRLYIPITLCPHEKILPSDCAYLIPIGEELDLLFIKALADFFLNVVTRVRDEQFNSCCEWLL